MEKNHTIKLKGSLENHEAANNQNSSYNKIEFWKPHSPQIVKTLTS